MTTESTARRRQTLHWTGIGLAGLGLCGLAFLALAWMGLLPIGPLPGQPIPHTDVNPFGANFFLAREVEHWKQELTLDMARAAGIVWIKQQFSWEEIEPRRKGEFDWAKYDRIVDLAEQAGMQIIARLDRPPDWTRQDNQFKTRPPDDLADYGDFVYEFVRRYRGRVGHIQVWNEPNLTAEWGFQRVDAVAYTRLLEVAYRRAKEADPDVVVLSGPLAITLEDASMRGNHNDLVFLEEMYQAGAGAYFDILSANAFGLDRPPEDPPDPGVLNMRRVELQREIMERYGDAGKPIWINEYGWNAAPEQFLDKDLIWKRVTEEEQAEYTLRGIDFAHENWPWAGVFGIWYFRQTGQQYTPDDAAYYFRMVDVDFTPRRVYDAVQDATGTLFVAPAGHFEETNPALVPDPNWYSVIAPEASGEGLFESRELGSSLIFTFHGHSVDLIARRGPEEGRLLVTVDGRNVSGLPLDDQDRSYIDLYARETQWQTQIGIVQGLAPGQHAVRLTISEGEQVSGNVDAFQVNAGQPLGFPSLPVALLGLGILLAAGALAWDRRRRPRREQFF